LIVGKRTAEAFAKLCHTESTSDENCKSRNRNC
jgi:hypothetical protein